MNCEVNQAYNAGVESRVTHKDSLDVDSPNIGQNISPHPLSLDNSGIESGSRPTHR